MLLILRVAASALIFRAALASGVLSPRVSRRLPQVLIALLEMGAPILSIGSERLNRSTMYAHDRPLTIELIERMLQWLMPLRERVAAVGMGRRQVLVVAGFLLAMTCYVAFNEYWSILDEQEGLFDETQASAIIADSFDYLRPQAHAVGRSARTVAEASAFLPAEAGDSTSRVVLVLISGLRVDAFDHSAGAHCSCHSLLKLL